MKQVTEKRCPVVPVSPPPWGRGLKRTLGGASADEAIVAPPVGAWIETGVSGEGYKRVGSPPPWGRGLKLFDGKTISPRTRRPPRGGVD